MTTQDDIVSIEPIIGMEIHVQLRTRTKLFTSAPSTASDEFDEADPNTLTDPVVLAMPGTLPVMNRAAVELSVLVGLAMGCDIAPRATWDRKSYFYPDLPKAYQISQYDRPLCGTGTIEVPAMDEAGFVDLDAPITRVRITRAHLEEDAGKLVHDAGARASLVDLNRAGTPLLEIVTEPDLRTPEEALALARYLRTLCLSVGATRGVMQRGHMRFEPNINCKLKLKDGREVTTPIVEVKNLNSFRSLVGAIRYELKEQPKRWLETGEEFGPGMKSTRGWDDEKEITLLQRSKEDALDYRYFPEPDLPAVVVDDKWMSDLRARMPELPLRRMRRYRDELGRPDRDAQALAFERASADLFDEALKACSSIGIDLHDAAAVAGNLIVQCLARVASERSVEVGALGLSGTTLAKVVAMRQAGEISANGSEKLVELCLDDRSDPRETAKRAGLIQVSDTGQLEAWCDEVIAQHSEIAQQIREGKGAAIGRLIGEVMKKSSGAADAKGVREILMRKIG